MNDDPFRWTVSVFYSDDNPDFPQECTHRFAIDELYELHDIIEKGPDFTKIVNIRITCNLAPRQ